MATKLELEQEVEDLKVKIRDLTEDLDEAQEALKTRDSELTREREERKVANSLADQATEPTAPVWQNPWENMELEYKVRMAEFFAHLYRLVCIGKIDMPKARAGIHRWWKVQQQAGDSRAVRNESIDLSSRFRAIAEGLDQEFNAQAQLPQGE